MELNPLLAHLERQVQVVLSKKGRTETQGPSSNHRPHALVACEASIAHTQERLTNALNSANAAEYTPNTTQMLPSPPLAEQNSNTFSSLTLFPQEQQHQMARPSHHVQRLEPQQSQNILHATTPTPLSTDRSSSLSFGLPGDTRSQMQFLSTSATSFSPVEQNPPPEFMDFVKAWYQTWNNSRR